MSDRACIVYGGLTDVSGSGVGGSTVLATLIATAQPNVTTSKDFVAPPTESVVTLSDPAAGAVAAPVLSLNAGAGAATAGTYHTAVAFLTNGTETAVGAASNVVTAAGGDGFHWASLPIGPAGTSARVLYRTLHGGSTLHLVAIIADNTTTVYTDNTLSDAVLGATTVGLTVGGFRLTLMAPADLTPANTLYKIVIAGITYYTTSFSYSATPITLASILSSGGFSAPSVAMTMVVATIAGGFDAGDTVTVRLSQDAISTISAEFFPAAQPFPQFVAGDGTVTFNLPRNDQLNPSGTFYQGQIGSRGQPFYFLAVAGGGLIDDHLTIPMAPGSIALTQTGINSTLTPLVDDADQAAATLADDISVLNGRTLPGVRVISTSAAISATADKYLRITAGSNIAPTLPDITLRTEPYHLFRTDSTANVVTLTPHSGNTINGAATLVVAIRAGYELRPPVPGTGTDWELVATSGVAGALPSIAAHTFLASPTPATSGTAVARVIDTTDLPLATSSQVGAVKPGTGLTVTGAGVLNATASLVNPMTQQGSMISAAASGTVEELLQGLPGQAITPIGPDVLWTTPMAAPGWADPTTTDGDFLYRKKTIRSSLVIGIIGDSLSLASQGVTAAYVTALAAYGITVTLVNAAVSGTSTSDWLIGGTNDTNAVAAFNAGSVDVVHIALGVNDARVAVRNSAATYQSNLQAIVNGWVGRGKKVLLNYPTYCVPGSNSGDQDATANTLRIAYQQCINLIVNNFTVWQGDTSGYLRFANTPALLVDGIHPTSTGNTVLGQLWATGSLGCFATMLQQTTLQRIILGAGLAITPGSPAVLSATGGGGGAYGPMVLSNVGGTTPTFIVNHQGQVLMCPL